MNDLKDVLFNHSQMYPLIQIEDLIKLIYQYTFGPKHLLNLDLNKVKQQIYLEASNNPSLEKEFVYIGNNLYRVSLINEKNYLDKLFDCFIKTANDFKDKFFQEDLKNNLNESLTYLSYFKEINKRDYIDYLDNYFSKECPIISHSIIYKEAYKPSYRLVHKKYLNILK